MAPNNSINVDFQMQFRRGLAGHSPELSWGFASLVRKTI
jgi:hypothetical protein